MKCELDFKNKSRIVTRLRGHVQKVGGWEEVSAREDQIGAIFEASMWIYTKAVVCNGQRHAGTFKSGKLNSFVEAVNGAWEILHENHQCIPQISIVLQECKVAEALHCSIEVLCVVQWRMLWFSAPTSFNDDLLDDGVILEQIRQGGQHGHRNILHLPLLEKTHAKVFLFWKHRS